MRCMSHRPVERRSSKDTLSLDSERLVGNVRILRGGRGGINGLIFSPCSSVNIGFRTLIGSPPKSMLREKYASYKYLFNVSIQFGLNRFAVV